MNKKFIASAAVGLAALGLIAWGIWAASGPASLPIQGQIESRTIDVASKLPGRVSQVLVAEGQQVKAGAALFEIESPELKAKMLQATAAHEAAESVSSKAQAGARGEEIRMAELNWQRAVAAAELAETTARRIATLYREGLIAQQKHDEAQTQARAARAQADAARAQYDMARTGARVEDKAAAAAQARQASGAMTEVAAYLNETRISAPAAGEVAKLQIHAGEMAPQGFPVITLVDRKDSWAVINVREDQLARFKLGAEFDAELPALGKTLRFKVTRLAPLPDFATWKNVRGTQGVDLRTFEVIAHPLKPEADLHPGMSVVVRR
ncbi:efflux RND transporter periplasmic adaptor subunit [Niveibacterium sp. 24ML]|uniref:HlyD family secretion protein n=1 Tax=Niveibacterium sp. 24ML TaxID=2985512 RepID=UPI002271A867|nr:efflux RND transporter periplasmic adaptor subunit [Niveibacterium sp. 24ML]MCX9155055.1 efflux RND transporter periplasmic adaptor subunit [Niveibacterium sp. 24ML]